MLTRIHVFLVFTTAQKTIGNTKRIDPSKSSGRQNWPKIDRVAQNWHHFLKDVPPKTCSWKHMNLLMHFGRVLAHCWYLLGSNCFPFASLLYMFLCFHVLVAPTFEPNIAKLANVSSVIYSWPNKVLTQFCQDLSRSAKFKQDQPKEAENSKHHLPKSFTNRRALKLRERRCHAAWRLRVYLHILT